MIANFYVIKKHDDVKQIVPTAQPNQIAAFLNLIDPIEHPIFAQFDTINKRLIINNTNKYNNINTFSYYLNNNPKLKFVDDFNNEYTVSQIQQLLADSKTISFTDQSTTVKTNELNLTAQLDREKDPYHIYEWVITSKTVKKQAQQLIKKYQLNQSEPLRTFIIQTLLPYRQLALITSDHYRPALFTRNVYQAYQSLNMFFDNNNIIEQWNLRQQFVPLQNREWLSKHIISSILNDSYHPLPIVWTLADHENVTIKLINSDYLTTHPHIKEKDIPVKETKTGHLSVITSPLGVLNVDEHVLHKHQQEKQDYQAFNKILDNVDK